MNGKPSAAKEPDWEALARYVSGESGPEEAEAIRSALDADPARARLLADLTGVLDPEVVAPRAVVDVDAALESVRARMAEPLVHPLEPGRSITRPVSSSGWRKLALRAAAVLALLVGPALLLSLLTADRGGIATSVTYATGTGERDSLVLVDGTQVLLGPATELVVLAGYGGEVRDVVLMGEAMFAVEHDDDRPFRVQVPGGVVEDLGTAFSVRTGTEQGVRVVVTEGSVRLRVAGAGPEDGVILREGDRGTLAAGAEPTVERGAATPDDLSWTRGVLTFRDASIGEVRSELRRWFGLELLVRDPSMASRHLTATFEDETVEQVANVIALALGGRAEVRADTAIIHPIEAGR